MKEFRLTIHIGDQQHLAEIESPQFDDKDWWVRVDGYNIGRLVWRATGWEYNLQGKNPWLQTGDFEVIVEMIKGEEIYSPN